LKLSITRTARDELEGIGDEIALTSPWAARRMVRVIRERTREIANFPYAFQRLETGSDLPSSGLT
jgi:plasmid stabilization system protein ParE